LKQESNADFTPETIWMIGDDVRDDVCGALNAGFNGILVKTGKYREGLFL
jgi:ribonucleotide monophosphatase NagD (HAD superfamily)